MTASLKKGKKAAGREASCPDPRSRRRRVWKKTASLSRLFAASTNRRFKFHERR